ncbi:hypothetical protein QQF64_015826 [Cirrhinus molitorella]|uniref:Uncharacterized protein n=1 Tax=Cirrhinus molitorella TaxID=172907 RepID=A0ABR3LL30_9TELE
MSGALRWRSRFAKGLFIVSLSALFILSTALFVFANDPRPGPSTSETISPSSSVLATLRLVASQYASLQTTAAFCFRRRVAIRGCGEEDPPLRSTN